VSISIYYAAVRKASVLLLLLTVLAAGCGSSSDSKTSTESHALDQSAARFVVQVQALLKRGRFAAAWRTLHPAEKRVVPVARLASCYPKGQFPGTVTFRATKTRDVNWLVPGTTDSVAAKEVTVSAVSTGRPKQTFTQHIVRRGSEWSWMLSRQYFAAAKSGKC
jgi:hypothetical protein